MSLQACAAGVADPSHQVTDMFRCLEALLMQQHPPQELVDRYVDSAAVFGDPGSIPGMLIRQVRLWIAVRTGQVVVDDCRAACRPAAVAWPWTHADALDVAAGCPAAVAVAAKLRAMARPTHEPQLVTDDMPVELAVFLLAAESVSDARALLGRSDAARLLEVMRRELPPHALLALVGYAKPLAGENRFTDVLPVPLVRERGGVDGHAAGVFWPGVDGPAARLAVELWPSFAGSLGELRAAVSSLAGR